MQSAICTPMRIHNCQSIYIGSCLQLSVAWCLSLCLLFTSLPTDYLRLSPQNSSRRWRARSRTSEARETLEATDLADTESMSSSTKGKTGED